MNVKGQVVSAVFLVKIGELPFAKLLNRGILEKFVERFAFGQGVEIIQSPPQGPAIVVKNGIFETGAGQIAFPRLHIEPRKMIIDLEGTSEDAKNAYKSLTKALMELSNDPSEHFLEPVLIAMESIIICHLEFAVDKLIAPELIAIVEKYVTEKGRQESNIAKANPALVSFNVEYMAPDFTLSDFRIGLSRKELTIGPLGGYPLTDQMFESKAPLDSITHERFLIELEETLS